MEGYIRREGEKMVKGSGSDVCFECGDRYPKNKLKVHKYPSRIEGKSYPHLVCKLCHQQLSRKEKKAKRQELNKVVQEIEPEVQKVEPKPEPVKEEPKPIPREPKPQSIKSDKNPTGYIYSYKYHQDLVIYRRETGTVTLDVDRLDMQIRQQLAKGIRKVISKMTGHKCVKVHVKSVEVIYLVEHPG